MMKSNRDRIGHALGELYPGREGELLPRVLSILAAFRKSANGIPGLEAKSAVPRFSNSDIILIAYADMLLGAERLPLELLADFIERRLAGRFSYLHILPFFPSSSDEGFSVMDYGAVDPRLGTWDQVARIGKSLGLIFDLVLNHCSAKGAWFRAFLQNREPYRRFFVTRPENFDAAKVFRPRTHPLLTPYRRADGSEIRVWTTFSPDQVDLDFSEPEVLLAMVEIALAYVAKGAAILRLDAVAFAWKEDGSDCINRPPVHSIVRLFRAILDEVAPEVSLLTETNLPRAINDSYFGAGDEARLVYNFCLPPLALHAFTRGRADFLASWAAGLAVPDPDRVYVNFLSSHDGIGVTPARDFLPARELAALASATLARGGLVSERSTPEGPVPYELNIAFIDAIAEPEVGDEARAGAFLACHAAMAALSGVPALYFHSLVGSRNWKTGPASTGTKRSIHRERLDAAALERELEDPANLRSRVFSGLSALISARTRRPAFAPASSQLVLSPDGSGELLSRRRETGGSADAADTTGNPLFALIRGRGDEAVMALVNVSEAPARCVIPRAFRPRGTPFDPTREAGAAYYEGPSVSGGCIIVPPRSAAWLDGSLEGA